MNYGQPKEINGSPETIKDSLNGTDSWNNSPERDSRSIGDSAINSLRDNNEQERTPDSVRLGEIMVEMPPNASPDDIDRVDPAKVIEASFNRAAFKTGDKLDPNGVKEIDKAIANLGQTGNVADFYDTAREAMEANIDNSFGRKLGA